MQRRKVGGHCSGAYQWTAAESAIPGVLSARAQAPSLWILGTLVAAAEDRQAHASANQAWRIPVTVRMGDSPLARRYIAEKTWWSPLRENH